MFDIPELSQWIFANLHKLRCNVTKCTAVDDYEKVGSTLFDIPEQS